MTVLILLLTFSNFVNELNTNGTRRQIEAHHFCQQLSESWSDKIVIDKIYDLKSIDYKYFESLYDVKITEDILNFRGGHENKNTEKCEIENLWDVNQEDYMNTKAKTFQFYNDDLVAKVKKVYKKDFDFFELHGLKYDIQ